MNIRLLCVKQVSMVFCVLTHQLFSAHPRGCCETVLYPVVCLTILHLLWEVRICVFFMETGTLKSGQLTQTTRNVQLCDSLRHDIAVSGKHLQVQSSEVSLFQPLVFISIFTILEDLALLKNQQRHQQFEWACSVTLLSGIKLPCVKFQSFRHQQWHFCWAVLLPCYICILFIGILLLYSLQCVTVLMTSYGLVYPTFEFHNLRNLK